MGYLVFASGHHLWCICAYYATADADEEDVILREKETVESEYDNGFNDGKD